MINPGLRGRTMLMTGANDPFGIGAAIALVFARLGAKMFLHYHRTSIDKAARSDVYRAQQAKSCEEVMQQIAALGAKVAAYEADFTDLATIPMLFGAAERFGGSVDVLVNNAATWRADTFLPVREASRNPFLELWTDAASPMSADTSVPQLVANACAPALLMTEFARRHVARGAQSGRIVNISPLGPIAFRLKSATAPASTPWRA